MTTHGRQRNKTAKSASLIAQFPKRQPSFDLSDINHSIGEQFPRALIFCKALTWFKCLSAALALNKCLISKFSLVRGCSTWMWVPVSVTGVLPQSLSSMPSMPSMLTYFFYHGTRCKVSWRLWRRCSIWRREATAWRARCRWMWDHWWRWRPRVCTQPHSRAPFAHVACALVLCTTSALCSLCEFFQFISNSSVNGREFKLLACNHRESSISSGTAIQGIECDYKSEEIVGLHHQGVEFERISMIFINAKNFELLTSACHILGCCKIVHSLKQLRISTCRGMV